MVNSLLRANVWIWSEASYLPEVRTTYNEWIERTKKVKNEPVTIWTFTDVTHAEQISIGPFPSVRIALSERDGPQPLLEPAWLKLCRPIEVESNSEA